MASGLPPCPQCGYALRWFAEQNAWGCDRCRQMFAAQALVQQTAMPQAPTQAPMQARPASSRSTKKVVVGAVVVLGGIIAIALIASGKSDRKQDDSEVWIGALERARDRVCACKDQACVKDALDVLDAVRKSAHADELHPTDDQVERGGALRAELGRCIDKLSGGGDDALAVRHARDEVELAKLRDEACACHNSGCAKAVTDEMKQYYDAHASEPEVSASSKEIELNKQLQKCFARALAGE